MNKLDAICFHFPETLKVYIHLKRAYKTGQRNQSDRLIPED
jgi:hypothetical protein